MANKNPIYLNERAQLTEYFIPPEYKDTMIYLTITVKLDSDKWKFASGHNIYKEGVDIYLQKSPEPIDLKFGYGSSLEGLHLDVRSHISRFRDGDENTIPPVVDYNLIFEAGDVLLDNFSHKSGPENPSDFNSFIKFKIQ